MNGNIMRTLFNEMSQRMMYERTVTGQNMSIGQLIAALEGIPDQNIQVSMSDGSTPGDLSSYRGYYSDLAIDAGSKPKTVAELVAQLKAILGTVQTGYKGGDYTMHPHTPVWWSEWGECSGMAVKGVREVDGIASLITEYVD